MSNTIKMNLPESFDFTLIAIITSEPIYRLCWLLNQSLKIDLKEDRPLQIYHAKRKIVQEFDHFRQLGTHDQPEVNLIQNRSLNGHFTEEQKQVDFWLKFEPRKEGASTLVEKIKSIQNISLAFEANPGSLKSKDRFIFSLGEEV
ncbi:MAG: IPExxxVDY family protein [Salinivirgaceae bacterium]|nr:IPExxxVDY family protein [Salinivirgaceae bacterium]